MRFRSVAAAIFVTSLSPLAHGQQLPSPDNSSTQPGKVQPAETAPAAPPEITPAPAGSPPVKVLPATPVVSGTATPTPAPEAPTDPEAILNSLSLPDIQEAVDLLKSNYVDPSALNDTQVARAMLQGLLDRLGPGVSLLPATSAEAKEPAPFRAEILDERVGYVRLGSIAKPNLDEMDTALQNFSDKGLKSVILDLRATPESSDFNTAAQIIMRFVPKARLLFTISKPSAKQDRIFTSDESPRFQGLLAVLVDNDTAGASEVVAAVLRMRAGALVVGERTHGEAVEFDELPLRGGQILRVGVAKVTLPDNAPAIYPGGVKPDLAVEAAPAVEKEALKDELDKGVSQFVFETERPRMNEASLVADTNPELDAMLAAQRSKEHPAAPPEDVILQHGMDAITSISVYENAAK